MNVTKQLATSATGANPFSLGVVQGEQYRIGPYNNPLMKSL